MRPPEFIPILTIGIALILGLIALIETHYLDATGLLLAATVIAFHTPNNPEDPTP
jgi:hypothetical protein